MLYVFLLLADESDLQRFVGNQSHSDYFKLLEQDGESLLVGARYVFVFSHMLYI